MHYYLYEIKNNINGKVYIGVHKTKVLDDGYMGSGKVIKRSIEKHGINNFTKTILEHFDNQEAMFAREKEVVTDEFLEREDTYNLQRGGHGGFDYINKNELYGFSNLETAKLGRKNADRVLLEKYGPKWRSAFIFKNSSAIQKGLETRRKNGFVPDPSPMNTIEANNKRKKTFEEIGHSKGDKNSQFGTMWITNGVLNKKIKKEGFIPDGWNKGRK